MRRLLYTIWTLPFLLGSAGHAQWISPQRHEAATLSIDSATGARCTSRGADRATVAVAASGHETDSRVTAMIMIPFGGSDPGDCGELLKHEEARSKLDLAAQLFEAGALTPEEFKQIADKIKLELL